MHKGKWVQKSLQKNKKGARGSSGMQQMKRTRFVVMLLPAQSPNISIQLLPHQASCQHLDRAKLEENAVVNLWVKSLHTPSLGKGNPVGAEKLNDPSKEKRKKKSQKKKRKGKKKL